MNGDEEIEITPAMIEAGAKEVWAYFDCYLAYGSETGRSVAEKIYLAMESARKGIGSDDA